MDTQNTLYHPVTNPATRRGWARRFLRGRGRRRGVATRPSSAARSSRVAVAQREGGSRRSGVTAIPAESGVLVSRANGRVGTEKPVKEIVQQMLRGPVQMLGVAIPGD